MQRKKMSGENLKCINTETKHWLSANIFFVDDNKCICEWNGTFCTVRPGLKHFKQQNRDEHILPPTGFFFMLYTFLNKHKKICSDSSIGYLVQFVVYSTTQLVTTTK